MLEDIISSTAGIELSAGRFAAAGRAVRAIMADEGVATAVAGGGDLLSEALIEQTGSRLRSIDGDIGRALAIGRTRLEQAMAALRSIKDRSRGDAGPRRERAIKQVSGLIDDIDTLTAASDTDVVWVEVAGGRADPRLRLAPVDVSGPLHPLWTDTTAVLTSATLPASVAVGLGLPPGSYDVLDVGSPFDYPSNALLYCAAHIPDPRQEGYADAMHDELAALIEAAGGRTLALFTSWRAMTAAVDAMRRRLALRVLAQGDLPKPALIAAFASEDATCLFATMGFWQGVDVPGAALSLVTIDRLPFPRPDEPLMQARREHARGDAFNVVDLPRAAMLLAQGAGRLIRTATDRGVVAVLDPRLATARYRWQVVNALPPMRRTRHRAEAEAFLRSLH